MKRVAGYIQRKSMLYEAGVEYGDYTMNRVLGCAHGCKFTCYAFLQKKDLDKYILMNNGCNHNWYLIHYNFFKVKYQSFEIE